MALGIGILKNILGPYAKDPILIMPEHLVVAGVWVSLSPTVGPIIRRVFR